MANEDFRSYALTLGAKVGSVAMLQQVYSSAKQVYDEEGRKTKMTTSNDHQRSSSAADRTAAP